ncbi:MAG: hypothetical protein PW792_10460 [Acidobacteriaceae bacterium]|nr:hypothetical protein [Acidobacteriaceae bacterium]
MVELTIVLAASRSNTPSVRKEAAALYKVDIDAIAQKAKAEFAAKAKAKKEAKPSSQAVSKLRKAA